jgi:hypothetical protein
MMVGSKRRSARQTGPGRRGLRRFGRMAAVNPVYDLLVEALDCADRLALSDGSRLLGDAIERAYEVIELPDWLPQFENSGGSDGQTQTLPFLLRARMRTRWPTVGRLRDGRKQSADIRRYRPWEKSTGPKTPAGKARASQNGIQHGRFSERELNLFQVIRDYIETTGAKPIHPTKALSWDLSALPDVPCPRHLGRIGERRKRRARR